MKETRIEFRASQDERKQIEEIANSYNLTISDYIRKKMLDENSDIVIGDDIYLSPYFNKHSFFTATSLYKIISMLHDLCRKQGMDPEEMIEVEKKSLEFARDTREKFGYKIIKSVEE